MKWISSFKNRGKNKELVYTAHSKVPSFLGNMMVVALLSRIFQFFFTLSVDSLLTAKWSLGPLRVQVKFKGFFNCEFRMCVHYLEFSSSKRFLPQIHQEDMRIKCGWRWGWNSPVFCSLVRHAAGLNCGTFRYTRKCENLTI